MTRTAQWTAALIAGGVWSMGDAPSALRVLAGVVLAVVVATMIAADADAAKGGA